MLRLCRGLLGRVVKGEFHWHVVYQRLATHVGILRVAIYSGRHYMRHRLTAEKGIEIADTVAPADTHQSMALQCVVQYVRCMLF